MRVALPRESASAMRWSRSAASATNAASLKLFVLRRRATLTCRALHAAANAASNTRSGIAASLEGSSICEACAASRTGLSCA